MDQVKAFDMPLDLNYDEICTKFDRLMSDGIITYQPSKPVLIEDKGMLVRSDHHQFFLYIAI